MEISLPRKNLLGSLVVFLLLMVFFSGDVHSQKKSILNMALANAHPKAASFKKESIYLSKKERERLNQLADQRSKTVSLFKKRLFRRYKAMNRGRLLGYSYLDTHIVRSLYETVLVSIDLKGKINRIEILSFKEPLEYLAPKKWLRQYKGKTRSDDLIIQRDIAAITGASFTTRSLNRAVKRILILHEYLLKN